MTVDTTERPVRQPPQQARSQASLDRIVAATRSLLEHHTFEELTIARIVREARSSVGVFYSRFADKDALLDHLDELYSKEVLANLAELSVSRQWDDAPLAELVGTLVEHLFAFHRERRGTIRALVLQARIRPGGAFAERTRRMNAGAEAIAMLLFAHRAEIRHSNPELAIGLGLLSLLTSIRELTLFPEGPAAWVHASDEALGAELSRAFLAYLGVGGAQPPGSDAR